MSYPIPHRSYTEGSGSASDDIAVPVFSNRPPNLYDTKYPLGKRWIDQVGLQSYELATFSGNPVLANWIQSGSSGGGLTVANADSGSASVSAGAITFHGSGGITTSGSGSTLTITGSPASGLTTANTDSGTATVAANALLFHGAGGIAVTGSGSTVTITGNGPPGIETLSGNSGTATGSTVQLAGAGSVVTSATGAVVTITGNGATAIATQAGTANVVANGFSIVGSGSVSASASGSTVTISASAVTNTLVAISTNMVMAPNTNAFILAGGITVTLPAAATNNTIISIACGAPSGQEVTLLANTNQFMSVPGSTGAGNFATILATNVYGAAFTFQAFVVSSSRTEWIPLSMIGSWTKLG